MTRSLQSGAGQVSVHGVSHGHMPPPDKKLAGRRHFRDADAKHETGKAALLPNDHNTALTL